VKILVTGAGGYLGSHVVTRLATEHDVFSVVRPGREATCPAGTVIGHNLAGSATAGLPEKIDVVVHLAQSPHYRAFPEQAEDVFAVNVASTLHLLQYARKAGAQRFVLASSGGISGYRAEPIRESDPANPPGFYLTSKHQAEGLVNTFADFFDTTILRYFFIYGPHQQGRLIPMLLDRLIQGQPVTIEGDEGLRFNPVYVDDAAQATAAAVGLVGHHLINVAGPEVVSVRGLVTSMAALSGTTPVWQQTGQAPMGNMVADIETMRVRLGAPTTDLQTGLRQVITAAGHPITSAV
jgi:nucleoside-diphosphate-sugar epimerase